MTLAHPSRLIGAGTGALLAIALVASFGHPAAASGTSHARPATSTRIEQLRPMPRITRHGSRLYLRGKPWKFSGVNMYWLGLDENVPDAQGQPTYPTHAAVDAGFAAAAGLGAQLVRSTTLGVSVGSPRSLEPSLDQFNNKAFAAIDYAVADARRYGIHLMIPLTDEWHYYEGGKHTFTNWYHHDDLPGQTVVTSNVQRSREAYFYHGRHVIGAFHRYIAHLLDHVNPLTGIRLGSDPTIAIWETGNELWDAPPAWTQQTAAYIKKLAPKALVADGSAASGKDIAQTGVDDPAVDIVDGHFYPTDSTKVVHDAAYTARRHKVYMVGEYPLTGPDSAGWLATLAGDNAVSGGLAWSLFPTVDGVPEQHLDGYTFHYPAADATEAREDNAQLGYARRMIRFNAASVKS